MTEHVYSITFNASSARLEEIERALRLTAMDVACGSFSGDAHSPRGGERIGGWTILRDGEPLLDTVLGTAARHRVSGYAPGERRVGLTACGLHVITRAELRPLSDVTCRDCIAAMTPVGDVSP